MPVCLTDDRRERILRRAWRGADAAVHAPYNGKQIRARVHGWPVAAPVGRLGNDWEAARRATAAMFGCFRIVTSDGVEQLDGKLACVSVRSSSGPEVL